MSTFEDREQAFENKFKHDQDVMFRINSRRAWLIGLWAAEHLGIVESDKAENYAREVVSADFSEPGYADIIRKLQADFQAKGLDISDHRITKELERQWEVARQQVATPSPI
ncbi:MAG: DUF1476 domain-containing protein [Rhodospirillaceae bacterium]